MDAALILQAIETLAIAGGLLFAGVQWRAARETAARDAQVLLLRSFDSPLFTKAMRTIQSLPDGLGSDGIEAMGEEHLELVWYWAGQMEGLGLLVNTRAIPIELVDNAYGGPVMITWHRLQPFATEIRARFGRDSMFEWFQWLAEQLQRLERERGRTPANVRESDWKP